MFKRKKTPIPPYTLHVLTTEYLMDGTVAGDEILHFPERDEIMSFPTLKSVKVQTTLPFDVPTQFHDQLVLMGDSLVAYIPVIELSKLEQAEAWKVPDIEVRGTAYVSHYKIEGRMMFLREDMCDLELPVFDVRISDMLPGTHWVEISAPFALINTHWLHGYAPLAIQGEKEE